MSKDLDKYYHKKMDKAAGIAHIHHKTKIVATVGPSCDTLDKLLQLVKAGVNVFRLNFSHGSHEDKAKIIQYIKTINKNEPYNISILCDLQGPKLRVGEIENNALLVHEKEILTFTNTKCMGTIEKIYVSYPNLANDVKVGNIILIDDGKIEVKVHSIEHNGDVKVKVTVGGIISSKKGINLPDTVTTLPALTEKDLDDLAFILTQNCDWIALSFVRRVEDIEQLREIINKNNSKLKIIAKIEKPEAVENIRQIILASDAIMIARGDLGVEIPIEKIPLIQKDIIKKCIHRAKPVIVATQMMESMIDRVKPNRSEVTDVANAVLEGADAVMLSGETATGQHPQLVIEMMRKIIRNVEENGYKYNRSDELAPQKNSPSLTSDAICYSSCRIATEVNAHAIIGMTASGYTAFTLSSYRPSTPLFIFTKEKTLVNQLSLSFGVRAFFYEEEEGVDEIIIDQINILKERGFIASKDIIISTGSTPVKHHLPTNMIKITVVD